MDCREARDHLAELNRNQLPPMWPTPCARMRRVRRLRGVPSGRGALRALIRGRHAVCGPPALRARFTPPCARPAAPCARLAIVAVLHPWKVGGLGAALAALVAVWVGTTWLAAIPSPGGVAGVEEHVEYAQAAMHRPRPTPRSGGSAANAGRLPAGPLFAGDTEAQLVSTMTAELRGKRPSRWCTETDGTLHNAPADARRRCDDSRGGSPADRDVQAASSRGVRETGAVLETARSRLLDGVRSRWAATAAFFLKIRKRRKASGNGGENDDPPAGSRSCRGSLVSEQRRRRRRIRPPAAWSGRRTAAVSVPR